MAEIASQIRNDQVPAVSGSLRTAPGGATPESFRRRSRVATLSLLLPAAAAALAAQAATSDLGSTVLFGLATLLVCRLLRGFGYPPALLPVSRVMLAGAGPVIAVLGVATVIALSAGGDPIAAGSVAAIAAFAMLVGVATDLIGAAYVARRPMRVAVLGSPDFAVGLRHELRENPVSGIELVGWLNAGGEMLDPGPVGEAAVERLRATIREHRIDLIVRGRASAQVPGATFGGARPFEFAAEALVDLPVRMMDGAQFYEENFGHVPLGMIDSAWYLFLMHPRYHSTGAGAKRALDLVVGAAVSVVALPLIALAAIAIRIDDRGPVLYRQLRIGEGGRPFEILKLRTMAIDAERDGARWSEPGDARITRVGRILRRTHVDELPQLLNVMRGEMTLVGPRPERPGIVAELEQVFLHYSRRHLVKPGVTGWAQVRCGYAGSELGTAWKLCHDLYYLKHRSALSDLLIMFETLAIAAKDAHRPLRMPSEQFVFGREVGVEPGAPAEVALAAIEAEADAAERKSLEPAAA